MSVEVDENAPLTAEEILRFGPVVEAQVWTPVFLAEKRAPIAQAAGRPKFGPVFNSDGLGKAVLIRPCVSRGKRIRGLSPIYTPQMLEANAGVFAGWPMYLDHAPPALTEAARKRGRSVKELGGQVITPYFDSAYVHEDDDEYGYQQGGVLSEVWASPFLRNLVGENPNLLHTSIAAWPTSGKPSKVPWNPKVTGMAIEGIRKQPQGSVDYVPRGGAGGRLLLAEGEQDPDLVAWPEPQWEEADERLVVSLAESFYASAAMAVPAQNGAPDFTQMKPDELASWVRENAPHLSSALAESAAPTTPPAQQVPAPQTAGLTEADVRRLVEEAQQTAPSREDFEADIQEALDERDAQRAFAARAKELIESAEGVSKGWKADLVARYSMLPDGPSAALLVEEETADDGSVLSEMEVLERDVKADLDHARDLIAEATGKPRVTGEGTTAGKKKTTTGDERPATETKAEEGETPYWREAFADLGIVESADDALSVHGIEKEKVEA